MPNYHAAAGLQKPRGRIFQFVDENEQNCDKMSFGLQRHNIYKKLAWLNELPSDEAEYVFRECGGSGAWARLMAERRPFPMLEQLFSDAEAVWAEVRMDGDPKFDEIETRLAGLLER